MIKLRVRDTRTNRRRTWKLFRRASGQAMTVIVAREIHLGRAAKERSVAPLYHEVGHAATWGQFEAKSTEVYAAQRRGEISLLLMQIEAAAWRWAVAEYERRHGGMDDDFRQNMKEAYGTYIARRKRQRKYSGLGENLEDLLRLIDALPKSGPSRPF